MLLKKIDEALNKKGAGDYFSKQKGLLSYGELRRLWMDTKMCQLCGEPYLSSIQACFGLPLLRIQEPLPNQCPTCTSSRIKTMGYGTEKLEEELNFIFQSAKVQRMDLDTTRSKTGYETIIDQFEREETNILVGTQMVTKGLDFDHVSLVGIFNADRMIHFPDFRSYERAYQLITQVSGRAGRRDKPGTVVIQTSNTNHPLLLTILNHDYQNFYSSNLQTDISMIIHHSRRLIEITVKHTDKKTCQINCECISKYFA